MFDCGEHDTDMPHPVEEAQPWSVRHDTFSMHRSAFEIRTYRLCRRVLMLHHVAEDAELSDNCLVRSTDGTALSMALGGRTPHYRFQPLLQKALEFCNEVRSFGNALLCALEKRDGEVLA